MIASGQVDEAVRLTLGQNPLIRNLQHVENSHTVITEEKQNPFHDAEDQDLHYDQYEDKEASPSFD